METQEELKQGKYFVFESRFPVWQCPCGWLNRFADTWLEICRKCEADHTLDWHRHLWHKPQARIVKTENVEDNRSHLGRVFVFSHTVFGRTAWSKIIYNFKMIMNLTKSINVMYEKPGREIISCHEPEKKVAIVFWTDQPFPMHLIKGRFYDLLAFLPGGRRLELWAEKIRFVDVKIIMLDDTEVFAQGWPDGWPVQLIEYKFMNVPESKVYLEDGLREMLEPTDGWATEKTADPRSDIRTWKEKMLEAGEER